MLALHDLHQDGIRIDGCTLPPTLLGSEKINHEVQMRRSRVRVARRSDEADHFASRYVNAFSQARRIAIEMRVVIRILPRVVEKINGVAARFAQEKLLDHTIHDGTDRRATCRHDVDGLMTFAVPLLFERIVEVLRGQSCDGGDHPAGIRNYDESP